MISILQKWDQDQLWRFCMAINYWVHDCVASEELAQNGEIYVIFDVKLTP